MARIDRHLSLLLLISAFVSLAAATPAFAQRHTGVIVVHVDRLVDTYLKDEPQHGLGLEVLVSVYLMCQVGWDP